MAWMAGALALAALLTVWAYSAAACGEFVFDDHRNVVDNLRIRDFSAFTPGAEDSLPCRQDFNLRWVGFLSFALNYRLGGLDPFGYHLLNVAIHCLNLLLVYAFAMTAAKAADPKLDAERLARCRWVAVGAAALFALHPLQTQAVAYVVQRFASLSTTFYLLAFLCYAKARPGWSWAALPFAFLAVRTKENCLTLPLLLTAFDLLFLGGPWWRRGLRLAPFFCLLALLPLAVGNVPMKVQTDMGHLDYMATEAVVMMKYLGLFLWPAGQSLDHDVAVRHGFLSPDVLGSLAVLAALAGAGVAAWRRGGLWGRLAAFGLAWFGVAHLAESCLVPIVDVMYEHRMYLPMPGLALAVAAGAAALCRRPAAVRAVACLAALAVLALAWTTWRRCQVWRSEEAVWADAAAKTPGKLRPRATLGAVYLGEGRLDEAERELLAALALAPRDPGSLWNLGSLRLAQAKGTLCRKGKATEMLGRLDEAVQLLKASSLPDGAALAEAEALRASLIEAMGRKP